MTKERLVALLLVTSVLASVGFAVIYTTSAQTQLAAACVVIALAALSAAMVVYEHELMPRRIAVEERGSLPSGEAKNEAAADAFVNGAHEVVQSRGWLIKMFAGAVATVSVAVLFPLRSLAPRTIKPGDVAVTNWRKGSRLVREDGTPVKATDLEVNSVLTVFPEGHVGPQFTDAMANDATVLVRVPLEELHLPADRAAWAPQGLIAFSKVCTHAGCPVALYRAGARQLFCPCHQSTFNVLTGGERVFGPAARALPQLPLKLARDGILEAQGDYPEPIGPGYWERA